MLWLALTGVELAAAPGAPPPSAALAALVAGTTPASPVLAGLAVVVADQNSVLRREAFGAAVIGPPSRALAVTTPVRVASISKLVVAVAVLRLVEAGRLDLDRDVSAYLGWSLRNPGFPDAPLTLRQLLAHTSGIDDGPGYNFPLGATLQTSLTPAHWSGAAPGARFSYANLNYGIIASVMEAATNERFDRLMTQQVLAPLRLDACFNWPGCSDAAVAAAATLYRKGIDETQWNPAGPWIAQVDDLRGRRPACPVRGPAACDLASYVPGSNGTLFSPHGGLRISALGLAKIGQLLLRGGEVDGVRLLKPATTRALLTPVWRGQPPIGDNYDGLMSCYTPGLQCLTGGAGDQPVAGKPLTGFGHLGEAYGLYGGLWIDPARDRVLVYLITGLGNDPALYPGVRSKFSAFEEAVLTDLAH
ncbi:MAG: serine hydrolase domain-containing protein [Polymorphobacter sp.]